MVFGVALSWAFASAALTTPTGGAVMFPAKTKLVLPFPAGTKVRVASGYSPTGGSSLHDGTNRTTAANDYYALDLVYDGISDGGFGKPILAPLDGKVVKSGWASAGWANYGQRVILRHELGDGHVYHSIYCHLDAIAPGVTEGSTIAKGERVGNLGRSCMGALSCSSFSGAHLHWAIHRDSTIGGSGTGGSYGGLAVVPEPLDSAEDLKQGRVITSTNGVEPTSDAGTDAIVPTDTAIATDSSAESSVVEDTAPKADSGADASDAYDDAADRSSDDLQGGCACRAGHSAPSSMGWMSVVLLGLIILARRLRLRHAMTLAAIAITGCANGGVEDTEGPSDASGDGAHSDSIFPMEDTADAAEADTPCGSATFKVTETQVVFNVPSDVRYMHVKLWGAGGNGEGQCTGSSDGGLGGFSEGVFAVKPGDPLIIIVGKRGRSGMTGEDRFRFGFGDWGGGGLSGVFSGPDPIADKDASKAFIIAGGGGSAGAPGCNPGGTGNHPDAGGMTTMQGGAGADSINGGAGGYKGGLGGPKGKPSSGGTGYVSPTALDSRMLHSERMTGTPPKMDDPDYDGLAGKEEQSGLVVIHFSCGKPVLK